MNGKKSPPFFIFGCPRSGTSLLSVMLNSHPNIAVPYETHIFNRFYPHLKYYNYLQRPDDVKRIAADILASPTMKQLRPPLDLDEIGDPAKIHNFGELLDAMLSAWAYKQKKCCWGEKTPHHVRYWDTINSFFPSAKVIHIFRDGRDVALSLLRARFGPKTVYFSAQYWHSYVNLVESVKSRISQDRIIAVSYDDLLTYTEPTLKKVCDFLGEQYSPEMLEYYRQKNPYKTDKVNEANLKKPVIKDNINKWQHEMDFKALNRFEYAAGETLSRYGYIRCVEKPYMSRSEKFIEKFLKHFFYRMLSIFKNRRGQKVEAIYLMIKFRAVLTYYQRKLKLWKRF